MRQDGEVCRPDRLVRPALPTTSQPARHVDNEIDVSGADDKRSYNFTTGDEEDTGNLLNDLIYLF